MAEKDVTQKILYDFSDVFADIVNVLLFNGEQRVLPEDLTRAKTTSTFRDDQDNLRWQDRDVAKFWEKAGAYIALLGIENQTTVDAYMPARVLSYDGASYKDQVSRIKDSKDSLAKLFPVITLVLHYGDTRWSKGRTLHDCLGDKLPPEMRAFVNDYKPFICDVAFLSRDTIAKFKSDFGQVAKFFVDCREFGRDRVEKTMKLEDLRHVQEVIDLLSAFASIPKEQFVDDGKGGIEMTSALQGLQEHWRQVGDEQGYERGKRQAEEERRASIEELRNSGVSDDILLKAFPPDEVRAAREQRQ